MGLLCTTINTHATMSLIRMMRSPHLRHAEFNGLMQRRLESHLDDVFRALGGRTSALAQRRTANLDVVETDKAYQLTLEAPGVKKDDLKVSVSDGVLSIKGEARNELSEDDRDGQLISERSFGSFERRLKLPNNAATASESVKASYEDGLLKLEFAKLEPVDSTEHIRIQ